MVRFAILGCGRIGQVHAHTLRAMAGVEITAIADAFPASAENLAAQLGCPIQTTDEVFANPAVDAVIIATPTDTHFALIQSAIASGKAVFCEKPVDMSAANIRILKAAVEAANIPFMTAFNRRFDPNFTLINERITAGDIGAVEMVTILSRDPSAPPVEYIKSSGGIFRDMMIHDFDMARFLMQEDPIEVYAVGSALVDPAIGEAGDVDTAAVTLKTASGKICQISNSRRASYGYDQRVEVHGSTGMLRADNKHENAVELASANGFNRAVAQNFFLERYADAYRLELTHFAQSVENGTQPTPNCADGLMAQNIADAASLSLETGLPQKIAQD